MGIISMKIIDESDKEVELCFRNRLLMCDLDYINLSVFTDGDTNQRIKESQKLLTSIIVSPKDFDVERLPVDEMLSIISSDGFKQIISVIENKVGKR